MSDIKLIAIDIDGTLLNSQRQLSQAVKASLQTAIRHGVKVVLCTGRPLKGVQDLLEELDLISDEQYVITYNGSLVQSTSGHQVVVEYNLKWQDIKKIIALSKTLNVPYHASDKDALYTTNKDIGKYTVHESTLVNMPIRYRTKQELRKQEFTAQKMMFVDEPELLDIAIEKIPDAFKEKYFMVKSAPFYLEILNKKANKGSALKALAEYLDISLDDVMAIGDNYNDMDMIVVAHHSVAMGNAVDAIKRASKYVTDTNDRDGVAKIVNLLVNDK